MTGTERITLWTADGEAVEAPRHKTRPRFNRTKGDGISWADWSWNPVTGCDHGCSYCYAREIAESERFAKAFPVGFKPLFRPERLDAPIHTRAGKGAAGRVFVCSMADLFGKWVPEQWIADVLAACERAPEWTYLFLTKFPSRYKGLTFPERSWVGCSVDTQRRVAIAQEAMANVTAPVKWLSIEPLLDPVHFDSLAMFDWIVIGAQTAQPRQGVPGFAPPFEWVASLVAQARADGVPVHLKPNLAGSPGMELPDEYPRLAVTEGAESGRLFDLLAEVDR